MTSTSLCIWKYWQFYDFWLHSTHGKLQREIISMYLFDVMFDMNAQLKCEVPFHKEPRCYLSIKMPS